MRLTEIAHESTQGKPPDGLYPAPPEMAAVFGRVMATYFPHMLEQRWIVLARDTAVEAGPGQSTIAACGVNDDPDAEFECVFWFSIEAWQLLDARGQEALIFHELSHCGHDEEGKPMLIPHDAGVFNDELKIYGIWWEEAQKQFKAANDFDALPAGASSSTRRNGGQTSKDARKGEME